MWAGQQSARRMLCLNDAKTRAKRSSGTSTAIPRPQCSLFDTSCSLGESRPSAVHLAGKNRVYRLKEADKGRAPAAEALAWLPPRLNRNTLGTPLLPSCNACSMRCSRWASDHLNPRSGQFALKSIGVPLLQNQRLSTLCFRLLLCSCFLQSKLMCVDLCLSLGNCPLNWFMVSLEQ